VGGFSTTEETMVAAYRDLAEDLARFAESLPPTIRPDVLVFVLIFAADEGPPAELAHFAPRIRETLYRRTGVERMGAVLRTIAAFDYVLARSARIIRRVKHVIPLVAEKNRDLAAELTANQPMRERHHDRALRDWTELRATILTNEGLNAYQDYMEIML